MDKAVYDSNVFVSAFIVKMGVPNQILRQSGASYILCTCEEILRETERILNTERIRRKYRYTNEELTEFLAKLRDPKVSEMVAHLPEVTVVQDDPTDNVILACAKKAGARFVVTGDQHLLQLNEFENITIVTPRDFLTILTG